MHDACSACGASFAREQGFYLGSIYINYGFTVIGTGALYALLVLGLGWSHAAALGVCLGAAEVLPTVGGIERLDPRFDELVPHDAVIEVLAMGFDWAEGPVWMPASGDREACLLFSDVPRNRIHRWRPGKGVDVFLEPSGFSGPGQYGPEPGSNGLALDREGRLILCEHGDRRVSRLERDGGRKTLADSFEGKRFNSPNDAVVHSSGAIYFTDPPYGLPEQWDDPRRELDCCGVYRIGVDGGVALLCRTLLRPNGICLSPDEQTLYVAQSDSRAPIIKAFRVNGDGTLDDGRTFFDATPLAKSRRGVPDGLSVDAQGNVFATGPGGVLVLAPDGTHLGTLLTGQATANCCFGADGTTLFITADALLCRVRLAPGESRDPAKGEPAG
jgi:gluconolactonase